jgi:rSAM/selenodomain-associated transferase 2
MELSVIIPVLNEEENLRKLLPFLKENCTHNSEILVVDSKSCDSCEAICKQFEVAYLKSPKAGRASQMNFGAEHSKGSVLYFVHADCKPPHNFEKDIKTAVLDSFKLGGYTSTFDSNSVCLKFNAICTKFNFVAFRGGDQTLFAKNTFYELGAFNEKHTIMEEYELLKKAKKAKIHFKILKGKTLVSTRKYQANSYLRVSIANLIVFTAWRFGVKHVILRRLYNTLIKQ